MKCIWNEYDPESLPQYGTACGQSFDFNEDGVTENKFKFCPYCGKLIEVEPFQPSTEEQQSDE